MLSLVRSSKADFRVQQWMKNHYSQPKGFVGRQLIYLVQYDSHVYGAIAAGSATRFLPGRNEFFGNVSLEFLVNNVFYHIEKPDGGYPIRNFTTKVVKLWRSVVMVDWKEKYGDNVLGFETLVELPRTGELYKRDGWEEVGITKGYSCKRVSGKSTDSWTGRRIWETSVLRPKRVLCRNP